MNRKLLIDLIVNQKIDLILYHYFLEFSEEEKDFVKFSKHLSDFALYVQQQAEGGLVPVTAIYQMMVNYVLEYYYAKYNIVQIDIFKNGKLIKKIIM